MYMYQTIIGQDSLQRYWKSIAQALLSTSLLFLRIPVTSSYPACVLIIDLYHNKIMRFVKCVPKSKFHKQRTDCIVFLVINFIIIAALITG